MIRSKSTLNLRAIRDSVSPSWTTWTRPLTGGITSVWPILSTGASTRSFDQTTVAVVDLELLRDVGRRVAALDLVGAQLLLAVGDRRVDRDRLHERAVGVERPDGPGAGPRPPRPAMISVRQRHARIGGQARRLWRRGLDGHQIDGGDGRRGAVDGLGFGQGRLVPGAVSPSTSWSGARRSRTRRSRSGRAATPRARRCRCPRSPARAANSR